MDEDLMLSPAMEAQMQSERIAIEGDDATAARLATLPRAEYDRHRKAEAKRLGIRESTLDQMVADARGDDDVVPDPFPPVMPWPDPVDGNALLAALASSVKRFIVCDRDTANAVALWITFTWMTDVVDVAPICMISSRRSDAAKLNCSR